MISAVVGGLAYAAAENKADQKIAGFRALAMEACLVMGPPGDKGIKDMRLLNNQLALCKFGATGQLKEES